jgi:hypothetical protein
VGKLTKEQPGGKLQPDDAGLCERLLCRRTGRLSADGQALVFAERLLFTRHVVMVCTDLCFKTFQASCKALLTPFCRREKKNPRLKHSWEAIKQGLKKLNPSFF